MNLPEPQSVTFPSLFAQIENGTIKIPQFQRSFVWDKQKSARLLDSVIKGYPIGTFILWSTKERLRSIRNLGGVKLPPPEVGNAAKYVIDGQQRLTSMFVTLKGLTIRREGSDEDDEFANLWLDLEAEEDADQLVLRDAKGRDECDVIRLPDLLKGDFQYLASFPKPAQERIKRYKNRIESYQFSVVQITDASINEATEIFTRLNVGGKPLSPFEIMAAKCYAPEQDFDLQERYKALTTKLAKIEYETIPESNLLQAVSILAGSDARRKSILDLPKGKVIEHWPVMEDGLKWAIDYFRKVRRIPASRLLPYPAMVIPFTYFFHKHPKFPAGDMEKFLEDFFWRVSLSARYSQSVESRVFQDIDRMNDILKGQRPSYDWAVNVQPDFILKNGYFATSRAFIKALLCLMATKVPLSFDSNVPVTLDNDWLKRANSRNYHHFFPKAYLKKKGCDDRRINHIANITLVDAKLNKEIRDKPPSKYIKKLKSKNASFDRMLATHLIGPPRAFGILDDNFELFLNKRCQRLSKELHKRILPSDADQQPAAPASETLDSSTIDEDLEGEAGS